MKYESKDAMQAQHAKDAIDTMGSNGYDCVDAAYGTVIYLMIAMFENNLHKVHDALGSICEHYQNRCLQLLESHPVKRVHH